MTLNKSDLHKSASQDSYCFRKCQGVKRMVIILQLKSMHYSSSILYTEYQETDDYVYHWTIRLQYCFLQQSRNLLLWKYHCRDFHTCTLYHQGSFYKTLIVLCGNSPTWNWVAFVGTIPIVHILFQNLKDFLPNAGIK